MSIFHVHKGTLYPTVTKPGCPECWKKVCLGCQQPFTLSTSDSPFYCSRACNPDERGKK